MVGFELQISGAWNEAANVPLLLLPLMYTKVDIFVLRYKYPSKVSQSFNNKVAKKWSQFTSSL